MPGCGRSGQGTWQVDHTEGERLRLCGTSDGLADQFHRCYSPPVEWNVEFTDDFESWWNGLTAEEQVRVNAGVILLQKLGPNLDHPYSTKIVTSRHPEMRELRVQYGGEPYRVLYAFDPRRTAILLLGGKKTGDDRWYKKFVRWADRLYDAHLAQLKREGQGGR